MNNETKLARVRRAFRIIGHEHVTIDRLAKLSDLTKGETVCVMRVWLIEGKVQKTTERIGHGYMVFYQLLEGSTAW